jgi:CDGSH-type Zn-finger protein
MKITIVPNGPILIDTQGDWTYSGAAGPTKNKDRVAFCRCGQTKNKPFCDGTHKTAGFEAGGGICELTPK